MNIEESIQQIENLIEAWRFDEADLNQTDINAMRVLLKKNQELKKQLEENKNPLRGIFSQVNDDMLLRNCGAMQSEIDGYKTQQKDFIKYLRSKILGCEIISDSLFNHNKKMKVYKEILQKYKSIIGVLDEKEN